MKLLFCSYTVHDYNNYYDYIEKSKIYVMVTVRYMSMELWKIYNMLFKCIVSSFLSDFVGFKANFKRTDFSKHK